MNEVRINPLILAIEIILCGVGFLTYALRPLSKSEPGSFRVAAAVALMTTLVCAITFLPPADIAPSRFRAYVLLFLIGPGVLLLLFDFLVTS